MKKFRVHLSSGQFITVHATKVSVTRGVDGGYVGYKFEGLMHPKKFLSFSIPDIVAIEEV